MNAGQAQDKPGLEDMQDYLKVVGKIMAGAFCWNAVMSFLNSYQHVIINREN